MELDSPGAPPNPPTDTPRAFVDIQVPRARAPAIQTRSSDVRPQYAALAHTDQGRPHGGNGWGEPRHQTATQHPEPERRRDEGVSLPPFDNIRRFCSGHVPFDRPVDVRPQAVAAHRREFWPVMSQVPGRGELVYIYSRVKASGLPNAMLERIPVPSNLNIQAWEHYLGILGDRHRVLDFIRYGFPTGYAGPVSDTVGVQNHPSATEYPHHVQEFIEKELDLRGIVGPFDAPPFSPWCHVSHLMTREKGDKSKRRIITDMTFPSHASVNAYIVKNGVYGMEQEHSLPTVDALARDLSTISQDACLATVDVSRAYKNFVSDPLDWPLLCFEWDKSYYCDLSMPFGARASSFHMQSIANCITDVLRAEGIHCYMYLDDLVILSPNREVATRDYHRACQLLQELGLPEAMDKAQPPARSIKWLGVIIDAENRTLSVPADKLKEILDHVEVVYQKAFITKKQLQSLLGHLLFVAKCVKPARVFVSRLLNALRDMKGVRTRVDEEMRRDLDWFRQFGEVWNGTSIIPQPAPTKVLLVDACLTGIGGTDGQRAYGQQIIGVADERTHITELEALNVVVALHTLLGPADRGTHVRVRCDNKAAVAALTSGRALNPMLQECARAAWMVQAVLDVDLSYDHIPGVDNEVADALSRAHLGPAHHRKATSLSNNYHLMCVPPCLFILQSLGIITACRSGGAGTAQQGGAASDKGQGSRHHRQSRVSGRGIRGVHGKDICTTAGPILPADLCFPRVCGAIQPSPRNNTKQVVACQDLHATVRGEHGTSRSPSSQNGIGSLCQGQGIQVQGEGSTACQRHDQGYYSPPLDSRGVGNKGGHPDNILCGTQADGGGPPNTTSIQPQAPPYSGGHSVHGRWGTTSHKVGQEHAKGCKLQDSQPPSSRQSSHVPSVGHQAEHSAGPNNGPHGPTLNVTRVTSTHPLHTHQEALGQCAGVRGHRHLTPITTQLAQNVSHTGTCRRVLRPRNPATRGVALECLQDIYRHPNWTCHRRSHRLN